MWAVTIVELGIRTLLTEIPRFAQFLRSLDHGDVLTEVEKNAVVAKKIGLALPEAYTPDA
jgi:hypothetical protein